ncbi:MAG: preprotein translocase subunit SecD [bacterium ADurb.Bin429]|nr:MAG: preprotein translocase subunit SecD [bacterium ADurb.Bin429]
MRRTLNLWLAGILLLTVIAFLGVFQPMTFSPRKDPSDMQSYLRPIGSQYKGPKDPPGEFTSIGVGDSKLRIFFYKPQHNLRLGLDLRGGMRVVVQIPNRAILTYPLTKKIVGNAEVLNKQEALITALDEEGVLPPSAKPQVTVTESQAQVVTLVENQDVATAQFKSVNAAMDEVFGAGTYTKPTATAIYQPSNETVQESVRSILEKRLNATGLTEVTAYNQSTNRVVLEIPGVKDPDRVYEILGQPGQMEFRLIPRDITVYVDDESNPRVVTAFNTTTNAPVDAKLVVARSEFVLPGSAMDGKSKPTMHENAWAVSFAMKSQQDRAIFARYTGQNVGAQLAIVLDGEIFSAPTIQNQIDGSGVITGSRDEREAQNLAIFLNAGALPVPVSIVENRTVSATLGADSVDLSMKAGLIGLLAVLIFMFAYYRLPGLMANFSLIIYVALTLAVLKFFDATLTLPGIAGLIISIGMAVDANIIIFERLKEELRAKKPLETAIDVAFARAWTAILDSNMASLITGTVLYMLGTGAVKGFAITLMIGVAVSMFTAITVTRLFLKLMVRSHTGHNLAWYGL